jgi:hypothetical protein
MDARIAVGRKGTTNRQRRVKIARSALTSRRASGWNMSRKSVGWSFLGAAIALVGAFGVAGPAQAALYTGKWDPAYGGPFPDLGWKASANFDVPTACLAQPDGSYLTTGNCAGFSVLNAELDFYNVATNPNPDTSPIVESFTLDPSVFVSGIDITSNKMSGIDTLYFDSVIPSGGSLAIAGNGLYSFSLILFGGDMAQLVYAKPTTSSPLCATFPSKGESCGFSQTAATGVITALPEPASLALALGGFVVMGFVARRRKS